MFIRAARRWTDAWGGVTRGSRKQESELWFCSKHGLLFGIIVTQSGVLFLLLSPLSGKVRLTGLRTTGSDGEERGDGGRKAHRRRRLVRGWRDSEDAERRRQANEMGANSLGWQQHVMKVKGRGRHGASGCYRGAPEDKGDLDAHIKRPIQDPSCYIALEGGEEYLIVKPFTVHARGLSAEQ